MPSEADRKALAIESVTLAREHDLASMYAGELSEQEARFALSVTAEHLVQTLHRLALASGEIAEDIWRACCMETGCDRTRDATRRLSVMAKSLRRSAGLAVGESGEGVADLLSSAYAECTELCGEHRLGDRCEVVECGHTLVVESLIGPDSDARRYITQGARHRSDDHIVEHWNHLVTRNHEHWTTLLVRCLHQPDLGLGYHGSASVIAIAFAMASSLSSGVWGNARYDVAMASPTCARCTESAS